jgi:hypothetical protein
MPYIHLIRTRKRNPVPTLKCECGLRIPVISNAAAVATAIEDHVWEHVKHEHDQAKAVQESNRLCDLLITQALRVALAGQLENGKKPAVGCLY